MQRAGEEKYLLARHQISWDGACHCDVWWGGAWSGSVDYNAMRGTEAEATEAWATGWALMPNHCWSHLSGKALETRTESHLREKGREIMHINNHVAPLPLNVCLQITYKHYLQAVENKLTTAMCISGIFCTGVIIGYSLIIENNHCRNSFSLRGTRSSFRSYDLVWWHVYYFILD